MNETAVAPPTYEFGRLLSAQQRVDIGCLIPARPKNRARVYQLLDAYFSQPVPVYVA